MKLPVPDIPCIVVFRTCGLGDFILSVPAFLKLRERFPAARIVLVTMASTNSGVAARLAAYAGGAAAAPWIRLIPPGTIDEVIALPGLRAMRELMAARGVLRRLKPDLIVQMMDIGIPWRRRIKKMAFAALLVGAVRQIGWRLRGRIERGAIPPVDPELGHHVHGPLQFMKELAAPDAYRDDDLVFTLDPGTAAQRWAAEWIAGHARGRPLVAIAPGAIYPHKDWPIAKFVTVVETILRDHPNVCVVVSGTGGDAGKAAALVAVDPKRVFSTCGAASIDQSAALLAHCTLVIGNDGGAMHLADAMGAKVISIVPGLEFPNSIEPWHNIDRAVRHPVPCTPCYSFTSCPEGHNRCMRDLPVTAVLDQIDRAMTEPARNQGAPG
jgi:heptosyltransferase-2